MRRFAAIVGVVVLAAATSVGAQQTWTGKISDSACGAKHESATENVPAPPDKQCTLDCVRGGSKFVLLADGKVYQITNQNNADLATHAGETVKITGTLKGDAITASKVEAAK